MNANDRQHDDNRLPPLPRTRSPAPIEARDSLVCVGLDPDLAHIPESMNTGRSTGEAIVEFNKQIIEATVEFAAVYKPQLAMYMQYGPEGYEALLETRALIPDETPVILDCKIGDISTTMEPYARAYLDDADFDAITVNPYHGKRVPGARLRPRRARASSSYVRRAIPAAARSRISSWRTVNRSLPKSRPKSSNGMRPSAASLGLVVGATYPAELFNVREVAPNLLILVPGIGSQAGDLAAAVDAGLDAAAAGF